MSNQLMNQNQNKAIEVKNILANENMKKRFEEILKNKASGFMASLINLSTSKLKGVEPYTVVSSAMIAATLDLPIDPNLGFAYIVPYKDHGVLKGQFQMGYKGFVQLALRTGQYKSMNVIEVYEGQLVEFNPLTEELRLDFSKKVSNKLIGVAAYFKLVNGFEKTKYWTIEDVKSHAQKYSKAFNNGPWQTNFNEMAKKTVLKNTIQKWGILSIEMQTAITADQAIVKEGVLEGEPVDINVEYIDNPDGSFEDAEYTPVDDNKTPPTTKLDNKFKKTENKEPEKEPEQSDMFEGTPFGEEGDK